MSHINFKVFTIIFFIIFNINYLFSVDKIEIPDTLIPRGSIYKLPVKGSFDSKATNVKFILLFNSRIIDIKSALGSNNYVLKCSTPAISFNFDNLDSSYAEISCDSVQTNSNDTICMLNVEGLVGPDSITYLQPYKLYINGTEVINFDNKKSKITVPGYPIERKQSEFLGMSYPNPSYGLIYFPFEVLNKTNIKFSIYDLSGNVIADSKTDNDFFKLLVSGSFQQVNSSIDKGKYLLSYEPFLWLSCGNYFLVMQTDKNIFNKSFVIDK